MHVDVHLLQIAAVCCSGLRVARAWVSRLGHWAARSHRGHGAAGGGSPLGVAARWVTVGEAGCLRVLVSSLPYTWRDAF